ncbi:MAG: CPBP family intramembrane metalloprotease [Lachnospiraceae bacterium]|nr:CPBP family intramembrane metalloprotease [Lachnospiraceae bacterium]
MIIDKITKHRRIIWAIVNSLAIILLGLLMQTGGAYLVNAAVEFMGNNSASSASAAASQYRDYMTAIRSFEPRQLIHTIFVGPLLEELVFRLIFLRAGKMILPFWAANLIQAVLFGLYHTLTIQRVYGFVMGLLIGCVFYYCPIIFRKRNDKSSLLDLPNSLFGVAITILLHIVINASGIYVAPLFPADIPLPSQTIIGCICMAASSAVAFVLYLQSKSEN